MNEAIIRIANLNKCYNHTLALDDVSVTFQQGRIYGFIGQNGAGKTTLLRIITGLAFPSDGELELLDRKSVV